MAVNENLTIPRGKIHGFCQRYHIRQLAIFGSALRDDFKPQSDVDVLVLCPRNNVWCVFLPIGLVEPLTGKESDHEEVHC